jgi:hypothetical protein
MCGYLQPRSNSRLRGIVWLVFFLFLPVTAFAEAFDTICLGINTSYLSFDRQFRRFWHSQSGGAIFVALPFYAGTIQGGIDFQSCKSLDKGQPDFNTLIGYVQWGERLCIAESFTALLSGQVGLARMSFAQKNEQAVFLTEHEIAFAADLTLSKTFYHTWQLQCGTGFHSICTHHQIHYYSLSFGVGKSFTTPLWLKEFLE